MIRTNTNIENKIENKAFEIGLDFEWSEYDKRTAISYSPESEVEKFIEIIKREFEIDSMVVAAKEGWVELYIEV